MKLTWHIIRKDVVRERWALLTWAALYVGQIVFGVVLLHNDGRKRDWLQYMQLASGGLVLLQLLMTYVLVARWVQADSPLGTDVHWLTRPISRVRMLAAKWLGAVLVFILGPVCLLLPWWLGCGFDVRGIFWTAVETMGWQLLVVAPAFLFATLTNEMSRMLVWSALTWIAVSLGIGFVRSTFPIEPIATLFDSPQGNAYTSGFLAVLVLVLGSGVVATIQYLSRRTQRAGVAGGIFLVLVVLVGGLTPWDWSAQFDDLPRRTPPLETKEALAAATFTLGPVAPQGDPDRPRKLGREASLIAEFHAEGLPENVRLWSNNVQFTWRWLDGMKITRAGFVESNGSLAFLKKALALPEVAADAETEEWAAAQMAEVRARAMAKGRTIGRVRRSIPPTQPGEAVRLHTMVPPSLIDRLRAEPTFCEVILPCVVTQPVIRAQVPLIVGAKVGRDSHVARVVGIAAGDKEFSVHATVLTTAPGIRVTGLWQAGSLGVRSRSVRRSNFVAVNPNGENTAGMPEGRGAGTLIVGGVALRWSAGSVAPQMVVRGGKWIPRDPEWRTHYQLVWIAEEPVGRVVGRASTDQVVYRPNLWEEFEPTPPKSRMD